MKLKQKTVFSLVTLATAVVLAACSPAASNPSSSSPQPSTTQVASQPVQAPTRTASIGSVADVPLITLNNEVQMPQLGLGTQIQRLESDSSPAGRTQLNETSRTAVATALQAGYRHLDTAHGYYNE